MGRIAYCEDFLVYLREMRFTVTVDRQLRVARLLEAAGGHYTPERLRALLAPVLATSSEEQQRFYDLFDEYFFGASPSSPHTSTRFEATKPDDSAKTGTSTTERPARWRPVALGLVLLAAAAFVAWRLGAFSSTRGDGGGKADSTVVGGEKRGTDSAESDTAPVITPPADTAGAAPPRPVAAPRVWLDQLPSPGRTLPGYVERAEESSTPAPTGVIALALLPLALSFWWAWTSAGRQAGARARTQRTGGPFTWPLHAPGEAVPVPHAEPLRLAARVLRRRQPNGALRLHPERTIAATAEACGYPTPVLVQGTQPPEYLVLIERASLRDHQARLFNEYAAALRRNGVHLTRYFYEDDPRACDPGHDPFVERDPVRASQPAAGNAPHIRISLTELQRRHPSRKRLLLFGSVDALVNPFTGTPLSWVEQLASWNERAILTPEPRGNWGAAEMRLGRLFHVAPASAEGLRSAAERLHARPRVEPLAPGGSPSLPLGVDLDLSEALVALGEDPVAGDGESSPRGPMRRWLEACAVYSELHWDLTCELGLRVVGKEALSDSRLLRLVRLPWFRNGTMPNHVRVELLRSLAADPAAELVARRTVLEFLAHQQNQACPGSVARAVQEAQMLAQQLVARREVDPGPGELRTRMRAMDRSILLQDVGVRQALRDASETTLSRLFAPRLRRWLHPAGLQVLGYEPAAILVAAVVLAVLILTGGWWAARTPGLPAAQLDPRVAGSELQAVATRLSLLPGDTVALRAARFDTAGVLQSVGGLRWRSLRPSMVRVDSASGRLVAVEAGQTRVTVESRTPEGRVIRDDLGVEVHRYPGAGPRAWLPTRSVSVGYGVEWRPVLTGAARPDSMRILETMPDSACGEPVARVDGTGVLTTLAPGRVVLEATVGRGTEYDTLLVRPRSPEAWASIANQIATPLTFRAGQQALAGDSAVERIVHLLIQHPDLRLGITARVDTGSAATRRALRDSLARVVRSVLAGRLGADSARVRVADAAAYPRPLDRGNPVRADFVILNCGAPDSGPVPDSLATVFDSVLARVRRFPGLTLTLGRTANLVDSLGLARAQIDFVPIFVQLPAGGIVGPAPLQALTPQGLLISARGLGLDRMRLTVRNPLTGEELPIDKPLRVTLSLPASDTVTIPSGGVLRLATLYERLNIPAQVTPRRLTSSDSSVLRPATASFVGVSEGTVEAGIVIRQAGDEEEATQHVFVRVTPAPREDLVFTMPLRDSIAADTLLEPSRREAWVTQRARSRPSLSSSDPRVVEPSGGYFRAQAQGQATVAAVFEIGGRPDTARARITVVPRPAPSTEWRTVADSMRSELRRTRGVLRLRQNQLTWRVQPSPDAVHLVDRYFPTGAYGYVAMRHLAALFTPVQEMTPVGRDTATVPVVVYSGEGFVEEAAEAVVEMMKSQRSGTELIGFVDPSTLSVLLRSGARQVTLSPHPSAGAPCLVTVPLASLYGIATDGETMRLTLGSSRPLELPATVTRIGQRVGCSYLQ
jgi:hypothetical protein